MPFAVVFGALAYQRYAPQLPVLDVSSESGSMSGASSVLKFCCQDVCANSFMALQRHFSEGVGATANAQA